MEIEAREAIDAEQHDDAIGFRMGGAWGERSATDDCEDQDGED
jgi:hypothetical protein